MFKFFLGDLKFVEKLFFLIFVFYDFVNIKVNVKVVLIENGIIFGNIGKELFYSMWCFNFFIEEFF